MNKKIIIIISIFLFCINIFKSYGFIASEHIELNFNTNNVWTNIYTIPDGKDLIIYRLYGRINNSNLQFRDNGGNIMANGFFDQIIYDITLTFSDNVEVQGIPDDKDFIAFGYLVSEDEDVYAYINGKDIGINKNIFTKDDIDYIYMREFVFMSLIGMFKFITIILMGKKRHPIRLF